MNSVFKEALLTALEAILAGMRDDPSTAPEQVAKLREVINLGREIQEKQQKFDQISNEYLRRYHIDSWNTKGK